MGVVWLWHNHSYLAPLADNFVSSLPTGNQEQDRLVQCPKPAGQCPPALTQECLLHAGRHIRSLEFRMARIVSLSASHKGIASSPPSGVFANLFGATLILFLVLAYLPLWEWRFHFVGFLFVVSWHFSTFHKIDSSTTIPIQWLQ